jgi:hypothetical protein
MAVLLERDASATIDFPGLFCGMQKAVDLPERLPVV